MKANKPSIVTMEIGGMSCAACALTIEKAVAKLPGIAACVVNLTVASARVDFDPQVATIESISLAIVQSGYRVLGIRGENFETLEYVLIGLGGSVSGAVLERDITALPGVISVSTNQATGSIRVIIDTSLIDAIAVEKAFTGLGLEAKKGAQRTPFATADQETLRLRRRLISSSLAGVILFSLSMGEMAGFFGWIDRVALYAIEAVLSLTIMIVNRPIYLSGLRSLFVARRPNMDTLVMIGTATAFTASLIELVFGASDRHGMKEVYFESAGLILVFIALGKYLEARAKGSTLEALRQLIDLTPKMATVVRDRIELRIAAADVAVGDTVIVRAGERIPVDGIVIDGNSSVDESSVTGEPLPKDRGVGDTVIGGTIDRDGVIRVRANRVGAETVIARIVKIIEDAQGTKPRIQKSVDTVAAVFVPIVIFFAFVALSVWLIAGYGAPFAFKIFVSVLIISCPCALGLATPTAIAMATGIFARNGILIKDANTVELTAKVRAFIFDKTGTLTLGKPTVTKIVASEKMTADNLLLMAASVECRSDHPIARALMDRLAGLGVPYREANDITAYPGLGITGFVGDRVVTVGNPLFIKDSGCDIPQWVRSEIDEAAVAGHTVLIVAEGIEIAGVIIVSDTLRAEAETTIAALKKSGAAVYMITGDSIGAAREVAQSLGLTGYAGELLPEGKLARIIEYRALHGVVAMVGDGINDAPSLTAADVGIAMGHGTDIAIESAGAVITNGNLGAIPVMVAISRYTLAKIKQNLFWAFAYNAAMIPLAGGILYPFTHTLLSPTIAGAAMAMSSVSVVSNSLTMRRFRPKH